jgi:hypothetical protein
MPSREDSEVECGPNLFALLPSEVLCRIDRIALFDQSRPNMATKRLEFTTRGEFPPVNWRSVPTEPGIWKNDGSSNLCQRAASPQFGQRSLTINPLGDEENISFEAAKSERSI